jgi:hypothetical protein
MRPRALGLFGCLWFECACAVRAPEPPVPARVRSCDYRIELGSEAATLAVDAHCTGTGITGFSAGEDAAVPFTMVDDATGRRLTPRGGTWALAQPMNDARIHYTVDLATLSAENSGLDVGSALRVGASMLAPASTFLIAPEPLAVGVPVRVSVSVPSGIDFETGLTCASDDCRTRREYRLEAHEMSVATYSVLGHFAHATVHLPDSELEIATLDGPFELASQELSQWVTDSARAVNAFYGRSPAPHTLIAVVPVPERHSVVFGKLLPESAPGVALLVGAHADKAHLYRDWILVHELFHVGFPSFYRQGKWLDEGSATYFEPLIRARAGWLSEKQVWSDFMADMPKGLPAIGDGLAHIKDIRGIYWGGAIICLLADVEARARSHGKLGLEDGFRAVLAAGGNASEVWTLEQVTRVIDRALGQTTLAELEARHVAAATPVDLKALWKRLGLSRSADGVVFDDTAELASIRHAIVFGSAATSQ